MVSFLKTARAVFGRSGGVGYHVAAFQYSRSMWSPFRVGLGDELQRRMEKLGPVKLIDLFIVGTSGGYCLAPEWLESFGSFWGIDHDPLAGFIFRRRNPRCSRFYRQDFFQELEKAGWSLERWLEDHRYEAAPGRRAVFLFSNLLGQLEFIYSPEKLSEVTEGLAIALGGQVPWLSFHDRLSLKTGSHSLFRQSSAFRLSTEEIARRFYAEYPNPSAAPGVPIEVEEHFIGRWIDHAAPNYTYFSWPLTGEHAQLIEVASQQ
ncbi:MAG: hypothetical protein H7301_06820 [Cryobacterium sp.]|nr:hypothetical protein [Oligoflexia bacterium]